MRCFTSCLKPVHEGEWCCAPQGSVQNVQRGGGLPHGGRLDLELRGGGDDLHPLEGPSAAAAGLPDPHQRSYGPRLHQVPPRVVGLGHPGSHLRLRWVDAADDRVHISLASFVQDLIRNFIQ